MLLVHMKGLQVTSSHFSIHFPFASFTSWPRLSPTTSGAAWSISPTALRIFLNYIMLALFRQRRVSGNDRWYPPLVLIFRIWRRLACSPRYWHHLWPLLRSDTICDNFAMLLCRTYKFQSFYAQSVVAQGIWSRSKMQLQAFVLLASLITSAVAHCTVYGISVNGVDQGDGRNQYVSFATFLWWRKKVHSSLDSFTTQQQPRQGHYFQCDDMQR